MTLNEKIKNLKISWAGILMYYFLPYRRKIIFANIDQVFGNKLTTRQKKQLAQAFYAHLACSIKEAVAIRFMSTEKLRQAVEVKNAEIVLKVAAQKRGVLILTGHFGNWEFAPIGGILNFKQFQGQFHFIRRTIGNKTLERILFKRYYQAGLNVIRKKNSLPQICDVLAQNHATVFVLDQHASLVNRDGIAVEFFGKKAGTYRSLASIARYTGLPVIPAAGYRLLNGRHVLEFYEPIAWRNYDNTHDSIYKNTLAYNQALEHIILEHPEQWLWLHKRWKLTEK